MTNRVEKVAFILISSLMRKVHVAIKKEFWILEISNLSDHVQSLYDYYTKNTFMISKQVAQIIIINCLYVSCIVHTQSWLYTFEVNSYCGFNTKFLSEITLALIFHSAVQIDYLSINGVVL